MALRIKNNIWILLLSIALIGCGTNKRIIENYTAPPVIEMVTGAGRILQNLPPASDPVVISVYSFADKTGQNKPTDNGSEISRAVTQGGLAILKKALFDAGSQRWFKVLERGGFTHLLQERKIIETMRAQYSGGAPVSNLPPLLFAGMLIEGGIIAYESNVYTGGLGARYLGIGANTEYRRDIVTIYIRASSVQTGEVLLSVNTSKTIFSAALRSDIFKFVGFDKIFEFETGVTINEPPQLAVKQAIEAGVYSIIMEGAIKGLWSFADAGVQKVQIAKYLERKNNNIDIEKEFYGIKEIEIVDVPASNLEQGQGVAPVNDGQDVAISKEEIARTSKEYKVEKFSDDVIEDSVVGVDENVAANEKSQTYSEQLWLEYDRSSSGASNDSGQYYDEINDPQVLDKAYQDMNAAQAARQAEINKAVKIHGSKSVVSKVLEFLGR